LSDKLTRESGAVRILASQNTWIEGSAVGQLRKTAELPGMKLAVGLPDLHPGKGSPIGAAFVSESWIYPALVGNDIGCGIGLWQTELNATKPKLEIWADRLRDLDGAWDGNAAGWLGVRDIEPSGYETSRGTIGGGNHFAELQSIESIDNAEACAHLGVAQDSVYLGVHSGSRGVGEAILRDHFDSHGTEGLRSATPESAHYLDRHNHAMQWAAANRELIAARFLERLNSSGTRLSDVCHNWVESLGNGLWLHRKGAAPSTKGPVVIPGSRGAFSYLVQPKDPAEGSAYSLAHGAGRKWSRSDSRAKLEKRFSAKDLARTPLGSHVICEDKALLYEEAPQAYKNITSVIGDLVNLGLIEILAVLKPLVTYKVRR
jgi:release factor H-coupled RctB family protein